MCQALLDLLNSHCCHESHWQYNLDPWTPCPFQDDFEYLKADPSPNDGQGILAVLKVMYCQ